jgi:hypothetical protein
MRSSRRAVLQPSTPEFRYGGRASKQGHPFVNGERPSRAGLAVDLGYEAETFLAIHEQRADIMCQWLEFRVLMRPAPCVYLVPESGSITIDDVDLNVRRQFLCWHPSRRETLSAGTRHY